MLRPALSSRPRRRARGATICGLLVVALAAAGCSASVGSRSADGGKGQSTEVPAAAGSSSGTSAAASPSPSPAPTPTVSSNLPSGGDTVHVDKVVRLHAHQGTFDTVKVRVGGGQQDLAGHMSADGTTWKSTQPLEPGLAYHVHAVASNPAGGRTVEHQVFRTDDLTLDQQTFPGIAPLPGRTVGVGMPVIVRFDVGVTDKASIERHLSVESTPAQVGAWHWISDHEVHWRPKTYWKPGTDVTVHADIDSVPAGNGIYGQLSRSTSFHVGDSVVSKVDVATHRMKVFINGKLARTMPISAGKPGFITRSGIKVIIEKDRHKVMDAATIGIQPGDPEYYKLDVEYAMRVTYSGEFLHAAPWSEGSQGLANVSHGCVGMSTPNAAWLFGITKPGDVVEVRGSDRHMTLTNGYGDWNESFRQYAQGSAL